MSLYTDRPKYIGLLYTKSPNLKVLNTERPNIKVSSIQKCQNIKVSPEYIWEK